MVLTPNEVECCEKRREARKNMLKNPSNAEMRKVYSKLNKEVKKAVKVAKNKNFESKIKQLENQYQKNDSHNLFKTVKELEGKPKKRLSMVKDETGAKHFQMGKVLKLWEEHFEKHLNTSFEHDENALQSLEPIHVKSQEQVPDITKEEISSAIRKMKNRKAPGADEITTEVIRAGGEKMIHMLHKIYNQILKTEKTPTDFSKMVVCPV